MLCFEEYDGMQNCRELTFQEDTVLFHRALKAVIRGGEHRFHVISREHGNFDLIYRNNDEEIRQSETFTKQFFPPQFDMFASLLEYDENKPERLFLGMADGFDRICFSRLNEYSIVLCKVFLRDTDKEILFTDERILWFFQDERIRVVKELPAKEDSGCLIVTGSFFEQDPLGARRIHDINLFNTVFCIDSLTDLEINQIRYVSLYIDRIEGIGAILINFLKLKRLFESFGFDVFIKEKTSRYDDELLEKYFKLGKTPADSNAENTIYVPNYFGAVFVYSLNRLISHADFGEVVSDRLMAHMEEYRQAVLGNQKVLGLMVRGTDYQKAKVNVQPIAMERLISIVKEKMEREGYEKIFLATEDKDKLEALLEAFPGKIVTVAQERYRLEDFTGKIDLISELEKKNRTEEEHMAVLEDTTVNYFYALYILTRCDAFIATPFTNGVRCVLIFNKGGFISTDILSDTLNGD